jgi:putative NADH-flavin reductase
MISNEAQGMKAPVLFISHGAPTFAIEPGSLNGLVSDAGDPRHISLEDYAVTTLDEIERPTHSRQRFTVSS